MDIRLYRRNVRRLQRAARLNTPVEVLRRQCCAMECLCSDREAHRTGCEAAHRQTDSDRERERERGDVSPQQSLRRSRPLCTRRECLAVQSIHSEELVNGDLLVLKPDMRLPCDVLLLRGCVRDQPVFSWPSKQSRRKMFPLSAAADTVHKGSLERPRACGPFASSGGGGRVQLNGRKFSSPQERPSRLAGFAEEARGRASEKSCDGKLTETSCLASRLGSAGFLLGGGDSGSAAHALRRKQSRLRRRWCLFRRGLGQPA